MEWKDTGTAPAPELAARLGVSDLVAQLLSARGLGDEIASKNRLNPLAVEDWPWSDVTGLDELLAVLAEAKEVGQGILVCGGQSAGDQVAMALCVGGLRQFGFAVSYCLEGLANSVDITAFGTQSDAKYLQLKLGLGVEATGVISLTDPSAQISVRISAEPDEIKGDHPLWLAGRAGLCWWLLRALAQVHNGGGETREFADLIALSSIVDGAAMLGLNRSLTQWGGAKLIYRPRTGLAALMRAAKLMPPVLVSNKYIDSSLGARLRAAERRGLAATSIDLLLAEEAGLADEWAVDVENGYREERLAQRQEEMVPERESLAIEAYIGLAQMRPALGHEISRLGPFGRGNPEPLLASRRVRLVNVTSTGLSRRHTRLLVEDEEGHSLSGLWRYKQPEEVPGAWGDIAFNLRLDYYRGSENVQLEIVAFRLLVAEEDTELKPELPFSVEDKRTAGDRMGELAKLLARDARLQIWAEAGAFPVAAIARDKLQRGKMLVLWTAPPGPSILREALERVGPSKVVLLSAERNTVAPGDFLRHLGGLVKWILANRDATVGITELAGRLGEMNATVLAGLELLAFKGLLGYREEGKRLHFSREANPGVQDPERLGHLLAESAAYRRYFAQAPAVEILQLSTDSI